MDEGKSAKDVECLIMDAGFSVTRCDEQVAPLVLLSLQ